MSLVESFESLWQSDNGVKLNNVNERVQLAQSAQKQNLASILRKLVSWIKISLCSIHSAESIQIDYS